MENKIQELTDKIYREGVEKGNEEAQKLIVKSSGRSPKNSRECTERGRLYCGCCS